MVAQCGKCGRALSDVGEDEERQYGNCPAHGIVFADPDEYPYHSDPPEDYRQAVGTSERK